MDATTAAVRVRTTGYGSRKGVHYRLRQPLTTVTSTHRRLRCAGAGVPLASSQKTQSPATC